MFLLVLIFTIVALLLIFLHEYIVHVCMWKGELPRVPTEARRGYLVSSSSTLNLFTIPEARIHAFSSNLKTIMSPQSSCLSPLRSWDRKHL